jgi:glutamyl-tRNA synthetase
MPVRTRFAPSPTGYLHIGGVRTALFCWLFARRHGGQFILRIDDTDQERHVEESLAPILQGLRWLGIDWDEGPEVGGPHAPYYQSQRSDRYAAAVQKLLASGAAYHDYATPEELQIERDAALAEKRPFLYSRRFMAETAAQRAHFEAEGRKHVVRLRMPRDGTLVIDDLVRGRVEIEWAREQDHVIQRADGTCLYHLANVVDDHDFEISHVIRAEEHLSNTARQVFIIQSLGYPRPQYGHLPFVAEPGSHNKLSKRKLEKYLKNRDFAVMVEHGRKIAAAAGLETSPETFNPVIVDFYRQVGYLPAAIINYLALLGWSLDDKAEFFTQQELIDAFSLERVNKAPASFDSKKLWSFQDRYMQLLPLDEKVSMALPYLERAGLISSPVSADIRDEVAKIVQAAGDRIKTAGDVLDYTFFFLPDDQVPCDEKAFAKWLGNPEAIDTLRKFQEPLRMVEPFESAAIEQAMQAFVAAEGIQMNKIVHSVRVAVTGKTIGFGLFDSLSILGRGRSLRRIGLALERAGRAG